MAMPPSRRNLLIISTLCVLTLFMAASLKLYESSLNLSKLNGVDSAARYLMYAPYSIPIKNDLGIFDDRIEVAAQTNKQQVSIVRPVVDAFPVSARAYLVGDVASGKIYLEKSSHTPMPVASMSKLITAFVATDIVPPTTEIVITEEQSALSPDNSHIRAGEKYTMATLLYPLLLSSSNVAAEALAGATNDRGNFLEMMRSYSWEVGMPTAFFADASGLSPDNAASAQDLFALSQYLYNSRADILEITRTPHAEVATSSDHGFHSFDSIHPFVLDPNFIGGKTGRTPEAGETMLTIMKVKNRVVAIVVLGSMMGGREGDTRMLLDKVETLIK